jgi:small subunit ribosomal protein S9
MADVFGAVGRRKTSIARVRLLPGSGDITVNRKTLSDFFGRETLRSIVKQPLELTNTAAKFNVVASVTGGGISGQAGAVRHAIARALITSEPALRAALKKAGLLTRDPRMKERKKYGQKGARKRFQFSKR